MLQPSIQLRGQQITLTTPTVLDFEPCIPEERHLHREFLAE